MRRASATHSTYSPRAFRHSQRTWQTSPSPLTVTSTRNRGINASRRRARYTCCRESPAADALADRNSSTEAREGERGSFSRASLTKLDGLQNRTGSAHRQENDQG